MGPTALLFQPKNPTASAGFEPANLGTKGQRPARSPLDHRSRSPLYLSRLILRTLNRHQYDVAF